MRSTSSDSTLVKSKGATKIPGNSPVGRAVWIAAVACVVVLWQPLFWTHPLRAASELAFYCTFVCNFWSGSQGTLNWLDSTVENWINYNNKNIPPFEGDWWQVAELSASNFTQDSFLRASRNQQRPIIVRGLFHDSKAVRQWSTEYLDKAAGELNVTVNYGEEGCADRVIAAMQRRKFSQNDKMQESNCLRRRNFGEFLNDPSYGYLKQFSQLYTDHPELLDDLELHRLGDVYSAHSQVIPTTFLGKGGRFPYLSSFHTAFAANYFLQVRGSKLWRLMTPEYTPYMQPFFNDDVTAVGSRMAAVDPPSKARYNFDKLPINEVWLEAGDFLYFPPWWWHEVLHQDVDEWHIGVGLRPVDSVVKQHIPILSNNWANTLGVLPITIGLAWDLYVKRQDFAERYYDNEEE